MADGYAYETGGANCNYGAGLCGVIIGDPDLKPESSVNYEAVSYTHLTLPTTSRV